MIYKLFINLIFTTNILVYTLIQNLKSYLAVKIIRNNFETEKIYEYNSKIEFCNS